MNKTPVEQDAKGIVISLKPQLKMLSGKTLLISGGSGFIGNYIIRTIEFANKSLLTKPCRLISIDNYITGVRCDPKIDKPVNLLRIEHDIRRELIINDTVDYIIHAAGVASPIYYKKYPLETIETAVWGAKNLLDLARVKKVKSFLFFSSSEIYGDPDPKFIPTPETYNGNVSSTGPRSCYDESKRLGETLCINYSEVYGVPIKIVRPFNIFGPGMKPTDYRVIPTFLYNGLKGKYLPVHDKGNQTRTFCYITDAIIAFFKVLLSSSNKEVYNVGNSENEINMMTLAKIVSEILPKQVEIKMITYPDAYPKAEPQRRCPDLTKITTKLGYKPQVNLREGLKRTLKWYQQQYSL